MSKPWLQANEDNSDQGMFLLLKYTLRYGTFVPEGREAMDQESLHHNRLLQLQQMFFSTQTELEPILMVCVCLRGDFIYELHLAPLILHFYWPLQNY